jgi:two-component system sensor histidine kinase/response regulator
MSEEKILVVEDDVISGEALREKLSALGYRVGPPAASGEEAVTRANEFLPDLILMDIKLAGGLDGVDAAQRIQKRQDVPVLYLTAYTDEETLRRAKLTAPYHYLVKPARDRELRVTVEMALHRHRLEKALREQYQRLAELEKLKDNLIHMIVHDMRSPLTVLMGNLEMARESEEDACAARRDNLDVALRSAEGLMGMINSLLDVSRLEEGKMPLELIACDLQDLAGVAVSAYTALAARNNVTITVKGHSAPVKADPALIRRVFENMVGNALKFTPGGGVIEVTISRSQAGARAEVRDSGPDIPPEYFDRIFEKFGQMAANGKVIPHHSSGLGLTFCKLAVEAHGGKIGVTSVSGQGNRFWFTLPGEDGPD